MLLNLISNQWTPSTAAESTPVFNPSRGLEIGRCPVGSATDVDHAVRAAQAALPEWANTPPGDRARILFRYKALLEEHFNEIALLICREHGKTLVEAQGDLRRGIDVVDLACGIPSLLMGQKLGQVARNIDGEAERFPVGVCAGITPYNFPAMIPLWMFPIALACGNTFLFKPSPKVPLTATRLVELFVSAGLPPGVLNLVHGGVETVHAILDHPGIAAVSFVGSTPVAREVYRRGTANGKRVQAAGGAKNFMIVMPDADMDLAADAILSSSFGCSGQRCMAGSVAVVAGRAAEVITEKLRHLTQAMSVGATDEGAPVGMGPLIDPVAVDRVQRYLQLGDQQNVEILVDGRQHATPGSGFYVGPSIVSGVAADSGLLRDEVFGPVLTLQREEDLDTAIALANSSPYGNGAVIYTRSGGAARKFARQVNCGMIGVNIGVPAPMALFPFAGWNESFFGDLHVQGNEGIQFYTRTKVTLTRWS
jgi:malonate-semialdehyde dehydrogenase (acetylating) / methylmalonate-semialdehyde dehydrogenase